MTDFNRTSYHILLGHLMKTDSVRLIATKHVQAAFFSSPELAETGSNDKIGVIYAVITMYAERYGHAPDSAALLEGINRLMISYGHAEFVADMQLELNAFLAFLPLVEQQSIPSAMALIRYIADVCIFEDELRREVAQLTNLEDAELTAQRVLKIANDRNTLLGGGQSLTLDQIVIPNMQSTRLRTGVQFIDDRMGNGADRGLPSVGCTVLYAPQGHGKTTLGIQLAVNQALSKRHSLLVFIEYGFNRLEVKRNLNAAATGIPTTVQAEHGDDLVKAGASMGISKEAIDAIMGLINTYLHLFDLSGQNTQGPDAVAAEIESLIARGCKPVLGYIDWAGKWADYLESNPPRGRKFDRRVEVLQYLSGEVAALATRFQWHIFISHQLATDAEKKGPFAENGIYSGADCRGFSAPFENVFVINRRDAKTKLCMFRIPKCRYDPQDQSAIVRLHGDLCCMKEAVGYTIQGKSFRAPSKPRDDHALPTEQPRRNNQEVEA